MSSKLFAVVAGAGTGTGRAAALRFAQAYPVVLIARTPASYQDTVAEINKAGGKAFGVNGDAADAASLDKAFAQIKADLPDSKLAAALYNVSAGFAIKPFLETSAEELDQSLNGNAKGFFNFAQKVLPLLLDAVPESKYPPTLLATGATAALKGSARFSTFAAGMFARRAITQSLAREFGPQGVHVAHAIIDGLIDVPRTKDFVANGGVEDSKISPDAIAESYWHLHTQHRSAFTQELDLRPYVEKF